MTFFHFGNCVALAVVPYLIVYRCSGLAEYSAFWKCVQAGAAYLLTQICKLLIQATFFPAADLPADTLDLLGDFLKCTIDIVDLVGIHFMMTRIAGKGQLKFMITAIGWATAELIVTRFVPFWVGARGVEFDWKYIQLSFQSNINLLHHISVALLVWLYSRYDINKSLAPILLGLLLLSAYKPLIIEVLAHSVELGSWSAPLLNLFTTAFVAVTSLQLYQAVTGPSPHRQSLSAAAGGQAFGGGIFLNNQRHSPHMS